MSWLFGYSTKPPQLPSDDGPPESEGGSAPPVNLTKSEKKAMEAYRFDSSALERAAQAARELERSSKSVHQRYRSHCVLLHNATA